MNKELGAYERAYEAYEGNKGLYIVKPQGLELRRRVILAWRSLILDSLKGYEVSTPLLIPEKVLEESGHKVAFKEELFKVNTSGSNYYLRPQTAQGIFANYKLLRRMLKGNPLVVGQVGLAFRDQKTTRTGLMRMKEFEQLEVEIFYDERSKKQEITSLLWSRLGRFLKELGIEYRVDKVPDKDLPHYSEETYDLYARYDKKDWQIGSISDRGSHDLEPRGVSRVYVIELSLGLSRIVNILSDRDMVANTNRLL